MRILVFVVAIISSGLLRAGTIKFSYPELQVTPLASETLKSAFIRQQKSRWTQSIPVQLPSILTLAGGAMIYSQTAEEDIDNEDEDKTTEVENRYKTIGGAAMGIGGFWLTATVGVSLFYKPYRSAYYQTKKMKVVSKRDQLIKERLAEQALKNAYSTARKIEHLSVWTNFAASAGILSQAEKNSTKIIAVMAGISSFLPYLFPYRWETTYKQHEKYKKRKFTGR